MRHLIEVAMVGGQEKGGGEWVRRIIQTRRDQYLPLPSLTWEVDTDDDGGERSGGDGMMMIKKVVVGMGVGVGKWIVSFI